MSLSRISNIEFERVTVSDDVVGVYIAALDCTGVEALELRKRAIFSNNVRKGKEDGIRYPPLLAMFEQFSDRISPKAASEIQRILERETGETVETLAFSSTQKFSGSNRGKRKFERPQLLPKRFAEICLLAFEIRQKVCGEMAKVDIASAIERLAVDATKLDYRVVDRLPSFSDGAFACIVGEEDGHTILVEEARFGSACRGVHFARHVVAHEIGHYYLHSDLLVSSGMVFFAPQQLAKNTCDMIGSDQQICQVVDNITEVEAEAFATLFLLPWTAFLKGTSIRYLADDYGEQYEEVSRYAAYFKNAAVIDAFKSALWARGDKKHIIFSLN